MSASRPVRPRRHALALVAALLGVYALYLVAGNVFLRSDLARELASGKPGTFRMDWSSAHTLWPGRVTLGDVRMQGQARRTQWRAQAGQVRGRVARWPLLRRQVRVPVTGAVAHVDAEPPRQPSATARAGVASPRPAGAFAGVDVNQPGPSNAAARVDARLPPRAPRRDPHAGGWTLRMDRIASDSVTGADLFGWRITGKGRAEVGFSGEVSLDGRWLWQGDALVLDRMHAANRRFQVHARTRLQGERRHGDLYAGWGVLGVGVDLTGRRPKLHLRNARAWHDGRPHLLS